MFLKLNITPQARKRLPNTSKAEDVQYNRSRKSSYFLLGGPGNATCISPIPVFQCQWRDFGSLFAKNSHTVMSLSRYIVHQYLGPLSSHSNGSQCHWYCTKARTKRLCHCSESLLKNVGFLFSSYFTTIGCVYHSLSFDQFSQICQSDHLVTKLTQAGKSYSLCFHL